MSNERELTREEKDFIAAKVKVLVEWPRRVSAILGKYFEEQVRLRLFVETEQDEDGVK
jgi:hypothetical protein